MMISIFISWLVFALVVPLAMLVADKWGARYGMAIAAGVLVGAVAGILMFGMDEARSVALPCAITGGVMAVIYCWAVRLFGSVARRNP